MVNTPTRQRHGQLTIVFAWSISSACTSALGIEEKELVAPAPCRPGTLANDARSPNCTNLAFETDSGASEDSPFGFFCASLPDGSCARRVARDSDKGHVLESRLGPDANGDGTEAECKQVLEEAVPSPRTLDVRFDLVPPDRSSVYWFGLFSAETGEKEIALSSDGTHTFLRLGGREERLFAAPTASATTHVQLLIRTASKALDLFYDETHLCPQGDDCGASALLGELDLSRGEWVVQLGLEDKDASACEPCSATYDNYVRVVD
jgi:hypothetical protein